jgi:hypothetical protein
VVGERSVSRYLARIRPEPTKPRSQTWASFLKNHARDIVAVDMFVVPTIRFQVLYIFIILGRHAQRLLAEFFAWYNQDRVHLALAKDAPDHRSVEPPELGKVVSLPRLGGLHHRYSRRAA